MFWRNLLKHSLTGDSSGQAKVETHEGSDDTNTAAEFQREEELVEQRSAVFKKELGLTDLALTQILFIVGLPWIGVAAKQGPSHVVLWAMAMLLFYIPSAVVVAHLNRIMPLEGGLYQWAKLGFNELTGFLVAWNLWLFAILNTSEIGLQITQYISYIIGPGAEWLTGSNWFIGAVSFTTISMLVLLTTVGLGLGKWVHKAGGALMLITFAAVLNLPLLNRASGALAEYHPLRTEMPVLSIMSLNLLGKMGFGALGGFEYVANLATQLTELKDFRVTNGRRAPSVVVGDPGPEAEAV